MASGSREAQRRYDRKHFSDPKNREKKRAYMRAYSARPETTEKRAKYLSGKSAAVARRKHSLKKRYGLTPERWEDMLTEQAWSCAICRSGTPGAKGVWNVDHDHKTGRVRGILCFHCNMMLGYAKDNPEILAAAIPYLALKP
jgi:hypothetical protein